MSIFSLGTPHLTTKLPVTCPNVSYIDSAPLVDVLFDQLGYLVAHSAQNCPAECPDCARLQQVKDSLLLPFRLP